MVHVVYWSLVVYRHDIGYFTGTNVVLICLGASRHVTPSTFLHTEQTVLNRTDSIGQGPKNIKI